LSVWERKALEQKETKRLAQLQAAAAKAAPPAHKPVAASPAAAPKNAAAKTGTKLVGVAAKDTTTRCSICGATVQDDLRKLVVRCSNGHEFDQDQNAARNLAFAQAAA